MDPQLFIRILSTGPRIAVHPPTSAAGEHVNIETLAFICGHTCLIAKVNTIQAFLQKEINDGTTAIGRAPAACPVFDFFEMLKTLHRTLIDIESTTVRVKPVVPGLACLYDAIFKIPHQPAYVYEFERWINTLLDWVNAQNLDMEYRRAYPYTKPRDIPEDA